MKKTTSGWMGSIIDCANEEETIARFEEEHGSIFVYFGDDEVPAFLIDSVEGVIRVCIYEEDSWDIDPEVHETRIISGTY
jgi:hypothetical protein